MTLNIVQLRERVAIKFPDVEQVGDSILRFTKGLEGSPYAVYYFDIAQDLPNSQETLTKYQDRVIGSHYFEGRKSLQWNNYLYFITSRDHLMVGEVTDAKELIERDRSYARKFVISEGELESILSPPLVVSVETTPHAGILSVWTKILTDAGIDKAIFNDGNLPARLKMIEDPSPAPKFKRGTPTRDKEVDRQPFIHSLELKIFREFPQQRDFKFGKVNLIFGRNGSGKTSLLEAIELYYCGRNKRNPKSHSPYELVVGFTEGKSQTISESRKPQLFRDRNLKWYGQPEVNTNNLYLSFSQFNFLDTDAAVALAKSTFHIVDDLSKLLVGPEVSKIWRNIERVADEIAKELKGLNPLKAHIEGDIGFLEKGISEVSGVRQESDSIHIRLKAMIDRVGWHGIQDDKEAFATSLVEPLTELMSIAQQATKIEWTASPVSLAGMVTYCRDAKLLADKTKTDLARLEFLRQEQQKIEDTINRDQQASDMLKQVRRFIDADLLSRVEELSNLQAKVATMSGWLAGLDINALDAISTTDLEVNIGRFQEIVASKRSVAETSLANLKKKYAVFSDLRNQSIILAQQLREIAANILQSSTKPDECPLCHTQFEPGELEKHINVGVDERLEALGQSLLTQLREREVALQNVLASVTASDSLMRFSEGAKLALDISVRSVLDEVKNSNLILVESNERLSVLKREIHSLESQGLSMAKLEEMTDQLRVLGYPLNPHLGKEVSPLLLTIDQSANALSKTLNIYRKESDGLQRQLTKSLGATDPEGQDLESKRFELIDNLTVTQTIQEKLGQFSSLFPWPMEKPLVELVVEAKMIRKVATELQAAIDKEKKAKATYTESIKKKEQLEKQLAKLLPRIDRFSKAYSILKTLQKDHSLNSAMEATLQENRIAIETIYSQIHSPAEFSGIGSTWLTLIRKVDGREAKLTEISSGQRAAFALSLFLAQNAQLKVAPPVILIDDPIAHVDDMNSLSFLDYLREVALKGQRQIFFATANEKLAALFERKFDFLGSDGFRRLNLTRNE